MTKNLARLGMQAQRTRSGSSAICVGRSSGRAPENSRPWMKPAGMALRDEPTDMLETAPEGPWHRPCKGE